jgi:hypothetical protein
MLATFICYSPLVMVDVTTSVRIVAQLYGHDEDFDYGLRYSSMCIVIKY